MIDWAKETLQYFAFIRIWAEPNKAKLALINKEIQCPICESILIMDKKSQDRLKTLFIIAFVYLPHSCIKKMAKSC